MEDILASIRRIIADDQSQANRPAPAPAAATRRPPPPVERSAPQGGKGERAADYGEVLDLARMPNAALPEAAPVARMEAPQPVRQAADERPAAERAPERAARPEERNPPVAQAAAPRPAPAPASPQQAYVNGYAAPTLVRDYEQGGYGASEPAQVERYYDTGGQGAHRLGEPADDDGLMSPVLGTSVMSAFETLAATVVLQNSDMLDRVMRDLMRPLIKTWLDENLPTLVERLVRGEIERVARGNRG